MVIKMKLSDVQDDTPLVVILAKNLLAKKEQVTIMGSDLRERDLIFIVYSDLDEKWIFRGTTNAIQFVNLQRTHRLRLPQTRDLRLPANAKIDDLLDLKKTDTHWELVPNWKRIKELGYQ